MDGGDTSPGMDEVGRSRKPEPRATQEAKADDPKEGGGTAKIDTCGD